MTREIKFRAWDVNANKMLEPWQLSIHYPKVFVQKIKNGDGEVRNVELMQFTGLKDKNGKEIYEGDIMKVLDRDWVDAEKDTNIYIVYWYKGGFMLVNKTGIEEKEKAEPNIYNKDWLETTIYKGYGRDKFEIIGNIYENPNLLN